MIVTDDTELYHLARSLRAHGWTRDVPDGSTIYETRDDDFFEAYRFILPGLQRAAARAVRRGRASSS